MKAEDNYKCIEFDCLEIKNVSDIFDVLFEIEKIEKECNITCTLNSIKISKLWFEVFKVRSYYAYCFDNNFC